MKYAAVLLLIAFGISLPSRVQADNSGTAGSDQQAHKGTIFGGIYTNEFFEFSVEIPAGWEIVDNGHYRDLNRQSREAAAKLNPELARLGQGAEINAPLLVMVEAKPWAGGKYHRAIRILSTDVSSRPGTPSPKEFLIFTANTNQQYGLSEKYVGEPEPIRLGGRSAWEAYFNQRSSIQWRNINAVVVEKKHILQFILTSPDEPGLGSLETWLRAVHFKDE